MVNITVFRKDNCPKCELTIRQFEYAGLKPTVKAIFETSGAETPAFREIHEAHPEIKSAPYVEVRDEHNTLIDAWSDFEISKIRQHI